MDRGVYHLLKRNITPKIAFGDFDSVSSEELMMIEEQVAELKKYKPEKDETDMELALNWALEQEPSMIRIIWCNRGQTRSFICQCSIIGKSVKAKKSAQSC